MNKNKSKQKQNKRKTLPIGQTLETADKYLKFNNKTSKELKSTRPVIIADKIINPNGTEEYAIIPGSTQNNKNTTYYGKNGIKFYRHIMEVKDNEGHPITQNEKFKKTTNSTQLPKADVDKMMNKILNHTKQSLENRKKYQEFKNRYKKSKS